MSAVRRPGMGSIRAESLPKAARNRAFRTRLGPWAAPRAPRDRTYTLKNADKETGETRKTARALASAALCLRPGARLWVSGLRVMARRAKKMQTPHDRMMNATTPEERQKVMDEQRKEMQGSMAMMGQMMHGSGTTGAMGTGMMGQKGKPADSGAQLQMMQKRMDMMQTMMDQQGMTAGPQGMGAAPKK